MLNIQVQACGLAIVCLVIYLYSRHDRVGIWRERLFLQVLSLTFVLECLDIISVYVIHYRELLGGFLVAIICKLYISVLISEAMFGVMYYMSKLLTREKYKKLMLIPVGVNTIGIILIFISPILLYENGNIIYSYGPSVGVAYIFATMHIITTLIITFIPSVNITPSHRLAVRTWMLAWIVAAVVQFFNPQFLLTAFASAFGLLVVFCALENPESIIDRNTRAFSSSAMKEYIKERYEEGHAFSMISIILEEGNKLGLNPDQELMVIKEISEFLRSLGHKHVFYDTSDDFYITFKDKKHVEELLNEIKNRFNNTWNCIDIEKGVKFEPLILVLEDSDVVGSETELSFVLHKLMHEYKDATGVVVYIDRDSVDAAAEYESIKLQVRDALDEDRIEVFYQPIYSVASERFTAAEGLVRIRNKDGSLIPPGVFIPIAEETGMIKSIDERVFEKTCKMLREDGLQDFGLSYIELNVSVAQCEEPNLADNYQRIMDRYGVNPNNLNLEVTESSSIRQKAVLMDNMQKLRKRGIMFSLDDFGTGESNLNYVISMPVSIVKFDMSMTQSYFVNDKTRVVMKNSVHMMDEMGLEVVLEGVETKDQFDELRQMNIDYIQGYYFSKPLPKDEFIDFIKANNSNKT